MIRVTPRANPCKLQRLCLTQLLHNLLYSPLERDVISVVGLPKELNLRQVLLQADLRLCIVYLLALVKDSLGQR